MSDERRIWLARPQAGDEELAEVRAVLESGILTQGPKVAELERMVADLVGVPHAFATTSATTALHLSLVAAGIGPGDEVLVPDFTFPATANVVVQQGAVPVLVDVELEAFALDLEDLERRVTPRSRAVMPVHPFGLPAGMAPLMAAAERHGLAVIEDAACALGATEGGRQTGSFGLAGCFSFHPRKSITTGEGGMLTTNDSAHAELAQALREHGANWTDLERHESEGSFLLADFNELGYNYRMTDLQGALGCAQMDRADELLDERRRLAARYHDALAGLDWLATPVVPDGNVHGYQSYVCLYGAEPSFSEMERLHSERNALMLRMEQRGIATRQGTHAPVATGFYSQKYRLRQKDFPAAVMAERLSIALPLYPGMSDDDQDLVVDELITAREGG